MMVEISLLILEEVSALSSMKFKITGLRIEHSGRMSIAHNVGISVPKP